MAYGAKFVKRRGINIMLRLNGTAEIYLAVKFTGINEEDGMLYRLDIRCIFSFSTEYTDLLQEKVIAATEQMPIFPTKVSMVAKISFGWGFPQQQY